MNRSFLRVMVSLGALIGSQQSLAADAAKQGYCAHRLPAADVAEAFPSSVLASNLPASFRGLWWVTDGASQPVGVASFATAAWNDSLHVLSFKTPMRNKVQGELASSISGETVRPYEDQYVVTRTIKVLDASAPAGSTGMRQVADGKWEGYIGEAGPYSMVRIVAADGTREAAFAEYLRVTAGQAVEVLCTMQRIDLAADGQSLSLDLPGGKDPVNVQIGGAPVGDYKLHLDSALPVGAVVYGEGGKIDNSGDAKSAVFSQSRDHDIVALTSAVAQQLKLSLTAVQVPVLNYQDSDLQVELRPGQETWLRVGVDRFAAAPRGLYELIVDADAGVSMRSFGQDWLLGQTASNSLSHRPYLYLALSDGLSSEANVVLAPVPGSVGGSAQVSLRPALTKDVAKGKLIVDGPAVTATLGSVLDSDAYDIEVPAGTTVGPKEMVVMYLTGTNGDAPSFVSATADGSDYPNSRLLLYPNRRVPQAREELSFGVSSHANGGKVWLDFYGDLNALNPDLSYRVQLKKEAAHWPW